MRTSIDVETLERDSLDEIVTVLTDAFGDYPVMRYVIGPSESYSEQLPLLVHLFASGRALRREPMFGVRASDGSLAAVALATPPDSIDPPDEFLTLRERAWSQLGADARRRYETLVDVWSACAATGRHHHLNMIGVRRAFRGTGLGKLLLEAVIAMAEADPSSTGVDLTTELAGNLAFYQRFGFRVIADAHATPELHTWTLFRALG